MNSLPRPLQHPHAANNNICDCFSHQNSPLVKDVPELFRCDWHYGCILDNSGEIDVISVDDVVVQTQDVEIEEDYTGMDFIMSVYSYRRQFQRKPEIVAFMSLGKISLRLICLNAVLINRSTLDPRLYPFQSKYHYCYSGFKVESNE